MADWREIAEDLARAARTAGCRCEYERTKTGVPVWFPVEGGGIERRLITKCSKCTAVDAFDAAMKAA